MFSSPRIPVLILMCCIVFGGCRNASQDSANSKADAKQSADTKYVAISVLTNTIPFYQDLTGQLEQVVNEHGYELIVTSGDRDAAKQQDQVEDFIIKKVSAIVLCPCDSQAIGPAIKKATAIRHGAEGVVDLVEYVDSIEVSNTPMPWNDGRDIIGLLTTPGTNVAIVRSISGSAAEKGSDVAFRYKLIVKNLSLAPRPSQRSSNEVYYLSRTLHDLSVDVRWPVFVDGGTGSENRVFRTLVSGGLSRTNNGGADLYFFRE